MRKVHVAKPKLLRERDIWLRAIDADDRANAEFFQFAEGRLSLGLATGIKMVAHTNQVWQMVC